MNPIHGVFHDILVNFDLDWGEFFEENIFLSEERVVDGFHFSAESLLNQNISLKGHFSPRFLCVYHIRLSICYHKIAILLSFPPSNEFHFNISPQFLFH